MGQALGSADIPQTGTDYVDGLGTGCMFIKRAVLEKMQKPYFSFIFREEDRHINVGEDLDFCMRVNDMGYKFYVDYSKVCKHYKTVCLLEVNNYAQEFAGRSIRQYDAMVRPKIDALKAALSKKKSSLVNAQGKRI
jgi:GT2 family glycosyltransferase